MEGNDAGKGKRRCEMMRGIFSRTVTCLAVLAVLMFSTMGMCVAGGVEEKTPIGGALDKLKEAGGQVVGKLAPDSPPKTALDAGGHGGVSTGVPVPDTGNEPDPAAIPGSDSLPGMDGLPGMPGMDGLPGMPGMDGLPELPGMPSMDPMKTLQVIDKQDQLFVVLTLDGVVEARLGIGKNLAKAPLLGLRLVLFDALAANGSLGIEKIDDNTFLVPLEFYLEYMAGDEGWKEVLGIALPLEISFPGAGMVPDGVQAIIDALYKYILKPILPLLPIYHEDKPDPAVPKPPVKPEVPPAEVPPTEVGGEVVGNNAGGSGDHLPFTGAELTILLVLIFSLAVAGMLLHRLERKVRGKTR